MPKWPWIGQETLATKSDGAGHSFNNSGQKKYVPEADKISWQRTLDFFAAHLAPSAQKKAASA